MSFFRKSKPIQNLSQEAPVTTVESEESISLRRLMHSLNRSQAVIEFKPDGTILHANENFLATVGYQENEIVGQHHRLFVDPHYAASSEYEEFWNNLNQGIFQSAEFQRFGKHGKEIWIQATYNPVFDEDGHVIKVIKFATDITLQKTSQAEIQNRSQAVIEFKPDGTILHANELFTATVGYELEEIRGQHHRMFMHPEDAASSDYATFWKRLGEGEYRQGEFRRLTKDGREIWLQGAYNPVFDSNGNVCKVIKGVSDITQNIRSKARSNEVGSSIARSVTEMSHAIEGISKNLAQTANLAMGAKDSALKANTVVENLLQSSGAITKVVDLIQDLADQTNLLALNATIEAARAGEAGRGFAVVAGEVKALSGQTASATANIRDSVDTIQRDIDKVIESISEINSGIEEVSLNTSGVAASVEEQSTVMTSLNQTAEELLTLS